MAYEIPQRLEYNEKIMFGLTFKQLAYAFLFTPFIPILLFKTSMELYLRIFYSILLTGLATGFMFLNLDHNLRVWYHWLLTRRIDNPEKIAKFVSLNTIKDDLIHTNDGRKIAVLKITPINFSIKPKESQEATIMMFQKFLNLLDFPIQVLMNTEKLDLKEYFKSLTKRLQKTKKFENLFTKYKEHLQSIASDHDVMNRNFYVLIPEKTDINIQAHICKDKLNSIGLRSKRLKDYDLQALIHNFFEVENLASVRIENNPNYIKIGNTLSRTIHAHGYPRNVESGFLDKIVSSLGNFDLSLHIEPYDIETMMISLNKELQKQRADLYAAKQKESLNPSLEIQYEDTRAVLKNLQKGKEKLFNVSLYVSCRAKTKEELDLLTKRIESELNALLIIPKQASFQMTQGFQSCAPLAHNALKKQRNVTTNALSAFFPFTSSFLQVDKTGVWLGQNKNNIPIIKDIFTLSNPNGLCLASSGSGKSYMAKLLISRYLLNGTKVMVIDPQGEYQALTKRFNGQRINLSRTSTTIINPLDLMGHDYHEKRLALIDLMKIMLGELTSPQRAFIDKALTIAYESKGITNDPKTWHNKPPILEDVLKALKRLERKAVQLEKTTIRSLITRMSMYVDGVFSFLNKHTNINFNNQFVTFDIGTMPKQVKPTVMFLVLDYIYMKMKETLDRKLLVIDEAWSLLGRAEDASYIFEIVKTCRKFNLALFLINQEVEGMLDSNAGKSVLANSSYTLLMRQKPAVIQNIQKTFFLSEAERAHLLTAGVGEGILLMEDEHSEIQIVASPEEHKIITTNPDELLQQKEKHKPVERPKKLKEVQIKVDPEWPFHSYKDISLEEGKFLLSKGFKDVEYQTIEGNVERFLIKPRSNESNHHCLLTYDIANFLLKHTDKVWLYETTKPDIIFQVGRKKIAIEVETGKVLQTFKKQLVEKSERLTKEYKKDWFFVVTHSRISGKYGKHGKTFDKRNIQKHLLSYFKK